MAQEGLIYAWCRMLPGQRLLETAGALIVKMQIDAAFLERSEPGIVLEEIGPAIKLRSILPGLIYNRTQTAIPAG